MSGLEKILLEQKPNKSGGSGKPDKSGGSGKPKKEPAPIKKDNNTVPKKNEPTKTVTTPTPKIDTTKEEVLKLHRVFKFFPKNSTSQIQIPIDENLIQRVVQMSKDINISIPLAYVRTIFELYGDNIEQIAIPKEYEQDLSGKEISIDLKLESFRSLFNLLVEQESEYLVLRVKNNILEPKSYNDKSNISLRSISIQPNNKLKPKGIGYQYPDKSDAVSQMKKQLGYTIDQTDIMTDEFSKFITDYQQKNQLPVTGEIDYDLVVNVFPKLKPSETTTTTPPTSPTSGEKSTKLTSSENTQFRNNRNVKSILTYSDSVDLTGEPDWDTCRMLIDTYSKVIPVITQSIKVGNMTTVDKSDATLSKIKKSVEWCIAKHRNKFRLKISDMNKINNLTEPFDINKDILK